MKTFIQLVSILTVFLGSIFFSIDAQAQCLQRYKDKVFTGFNYVPNISYGGDKENFDGTITDLVFNLFEPLGDTVSTRPLIILIHGGSFTNDPPLDRKSPDIAELARDLSKKGYVVISPEYRLYSGSTTYEKLATTIISAFLDIQQLMCFLEESYENGNPYRIDTSMVIMGGSSAGAIIPMNFNEFIKTSSDIPDYFEEFVQKAADFDGLDFNDVLQNKYCGLKAKGIISISGAIIDTNYIQTTDVSFLVVHGEKDGAIPYYSGNALGKSILPIVYGPGVYLDKMTRLGIDFEADLYPEAYHVPIMQPFGDSLELAIQNTLLTGSIFNQPYMDNTKKHISEFCYRLMGSPNACEVTNLKPNAVSGQLSIYPNPTSGIFQLEIPRNLLLQKSTIQINDISGRLVFEKQIQSNGKSIFLDMSNQNKGMYILSILTENEGEKSLYTEKVLVY